MKYLCLVYVQESTFDSMSQSELDAMQDAALASDEELRRSGKLIMAQALQPVTEATTVRIRNGKLSTTDGPFAETTEHLGGFIFIEATDLNEAIQIAGRSPMARVGSIEVRPVMDLAAVVRDRPAQ
jgi:hypothetical protein